MPEVCVVEMEEAGKTGCGHTVKYPECFGLYPEGMQGYGKVSERSFSLYSGKWMGAGGRKGRKKWDRKPVMPVSVTEK